MFILFARPCLAYVQLNNFWPTAASRTVRAWSQNTLAGEKDASFSPALDALRREPSPS